MKYRKQPVLLKIDKKDYNDITDHMDEIFKMVDFKYKNGIKNAIKINKYSLIDVTNKILIATYHEASRNIFLNYSYFKNCKKYYRMVEDIHGTELFLINGSKYEKTWDTKKNIFVLDGIFSSTVINTTTEHINIYWDNIPNWKSRKDKLLDFLKEEC